MEVEIQIDKWETKFNGVCSSPSRPDWHSFVKGTKQVLVRSELQEHELRIHQERRIEELESKVTSRKVLQKFGGLTARDAQRKLDERRQKEDAAEAKRQQKARDKIWRAEKKAKYREGVEARELERQWKRKVKVLEKAS
jgi:hypothetical protein